MTSRFGTSPWRYSQQIFSSFSRIVRMSTEHRKDLQSLLELWRYFPHSFLILSPYPLRERPLVTRLPTAIITPPDGHNPSSSIRTVGFGIIYDHFAPSKKQFLSSCALPPYWQYLTATKTSCLRLRTSTQSLLMLHADPVNMDVFFSFVAKRKHHPFPAVTRFDDRVELVVHLFRSLHHKV